MIRDGWLTVPPIEIDFRTQKCTDTNIQAKRGQASTMSQNDNGDKCPQSNQGRQQELSKEVNSLPYNSHHMHRTVPMAYLRTHMALVNRLQISAQSGIIHARPRGKKEKRIKNPSPVQETLPLLGHT